MIMDLWHCDIAAYDEDKILEEVRKYESYEGGKVA
jgi:hypothetical protein